jgi:tetratricopeptide (TPR) repeat protein
MNRILLGLLLLFALLCSACLNNKNTAQHRYYHRLTAYFNGYYNAKALYGQVQEKYQRNYRADYNQLLSLFQDADSVQMAMFYADLDSVIAKSYNTIELHTLEFNGKEQVPTIAELWLLIGKCYYDKRAFARAEQVFQRILSDYPNTKTTAEAEMYYIATAIHLDKLERAKVLLTQASKKNLPEKAPFTLQSLWAYYFSAEKDYTNAAFHLEKALAQKPNKKWRTYWYFTLAQYYETFNDVLNAQANYQKSIKQKYKYDLELNAQLNTALLIGSADSQNLALAYKKVERLTFAKRNEKHGDRLYFVLFVLAEKMGKTELARKNLMKAVYAQGDNPSQQALNFMRLADLLFEEKEYLQAQSYYSKSLEKLDNKHPEYLRIQNRSAGLTELAGYLKTIKTQDSLQGVSRLDSLEIDNYIAQMIEKRRQMLRVQASESNKGAFYFDNQEQLAQGLANFSKTFGNRNLEDDWRRTQKTTALSRANLFYANAQGAMAERDELSVGFYRKNLFKDSADFLKSDSLIVQALYHSALLLKEQLQDLPSAMAQLDTLQVRYPQSVYQLSAYYQKFRIYQNLKQDENANQVLANMQNLCATCLETRLALQEELHIKPNAKGDWAEYEYVLTDFSLGKYLETLQGLERMLLENLAPALLAKAKYLRLLALSELGRLAEYRIALQDFLYNCPEAEPQAKENAKLWLLAINQSKGI